VVKLKYLGMAITNQNCIREGINIRLNSGNTCYHSVQNLLSSHLLSKDLIKIYKTIILSLLLYGCEIWPITLREECRLNVFDSRVLKGIFEHKQEEVTGG
jgi:hypothetical protein